MGHVKVSQSFFFDKLVYFKILSPLNGWNSCKKRIKSGEKVNEGFVYTSDMNKDWLKNGSLEKWLKDQNNY